MAEALKNLINTDTVERAARALQSAWPAFPQAAFTRQACHGLDALEFKARAMQLADALEATLPSDFGHAADIIETGLAPPIPLDALGEPVGLASGETRAGAEAGLSGWVVWSLAEFVARQGMASDRLPRALACLHALTQRFSAEFAIRPFIQRHPGPVLDTLAVWVNDPSAHVRRLVSEGSRPRLPWGLRLQALVADPSPTLPLLLALQDDTSAYVRRSVANHLNDIAKDHPERVAQWVREHLPEAGTQRRALLRHASRSLIKQGHAPTLVAWGLDLGFQGETLLRLPVSQTRIGGEIVLDVRLNSHSPQAQHLVIDYVVHHVKANGSTRPKVFKGWNLLIQPNSECSLTKMHRLRSVSTRTLYTGRHRIDLQINGQVCASGAFELLP
jgi:3-methyladenine DNA glycosylase AlkC